MAYGEIDCLCRRTLPCRQLGELAPSMCGWRTYLVRWLDYVMATACRSAVYFCYGNELRICSTFILYMGSLCSTSMQALTATGKLSISVARNLAKLGKVYAVIIYVDWHHTHNLRLAMLIELQRFYFRLVALVEEIGWELQYRAGARRGVYFRKL